MKYLQVIFLVLVAYHQTVHCEEENVVAKNGDDGYDMKSIHDNADQEPRELTEDKENKHSMVEENTEDSIMQLHEFEAKAEGIANCYKTHVRLVGGRGKHEGRLEVYYQGRWGTVCQRNFDMNDATVACRQLGFPGTVAFQIGSQVSTLYGRTSAPIHLDKMQCRGSEPSLFHCGHSGIGAVSGCSHNNDVGVVCMPRRSTDICEKRGGEGTVCLRKVRYEIKNRRVCGGVFIRYKRQYGTICDDHADNKDATVICRQLGYQRQGYMHTCGTRCGGGRSPIWLSDLNCRGNEKSLKHCSISAWGRHNCGHNEDIGVCCLL